MRPALLLLTALAVTMVSPAAFALQPLETFLSGASAANLDTRSTRATALQRAEELDQAWAKLGPTLTARGAYTRNEYAAIVTLPPIGGAPPRTATITPLDQWDGTFTADVPLVDLGSWSKIRAARASLWAAAERVLASEDDVKKVVVQTYTRAVASEALLGAADAQAAAAEASLRIVRTKAGAGTASDLDIERAVAEVARTRQSVADAAYSVATSRNQLHSLTGVAPSPGAPPLVDDLHPEAPLEAFLAGAERVPSVTAAGADAVASRRTADAAYDALLPTIGGTGTERFTNAVGFGTSPAWAVGGYVQIKLDLFTLEGARASRAASEVARVAVDKARQTARDAVFEAWHLVASSIAKSAAARDDARASAHAAQLAGSRYAIGTGTQLEMVQAERDAFTAEVNRIQADADLVYARALVRILSGHEPEIGVSP
jgi:outer membrane protein TolC